MASPVLFQTGLQEPLDGDGAQSPQCQEMPSGLLPGQRDPPVPLHVPNRLVFTGGWVGLHGEDRWPLCGLGEQWLDVDMAAHLKRCDFSRPSSDSRSESWDLLGSEAATDTVLHFFSKVLQVHGLGCVQWIRQQLHQCHVLNQEGLLDQTGFLGVPQGKKDGPHKGPWTMLQTHQGLILSLVLIGHSPSSWFLQMHDGCLWSSMDEEVFSCPWSFSYWDRDGVSTAVRER